MHPTAGLVMTRPIRRVRASTRQQAPATPPRAQPPSSTTGEPLEGVPGCCHSGMLRGARALHARLGALLAAFEAGGGGRRVTLVGHSLGAGVAAILACLLRRPGGAGRAQCYAFEAPACMDLAIAEACSGT